jgi:polyhydroxyalkanoate synthesis regulator phasin
MPASYLDDVGIAADAETRKLKATIEELEVQIAAFKSGELARIYACGAAAARTERDVLQLEVVQLESRVADLEVLLERVLDQAPAAQWTSLSSLTEDIRAALKR